MDSFGQSLEHDFLVPGGMALNVDGDRQTGDVGGISLHVHGESGSSPAEACDVLVRERRL